MCYLIFRWLIEKDLRSCGFCGRFELRTFSIFKIMHWQLILGLDF